MGSLETFEDAVRRGGTLPLEVLHDALRRGWEEDPELGSARWGSEKMWKDALTLELSADEVQLLAKYSGVLGRDDDAQRVLERIAEHPRATRTTFWTLAMGSLGDTTNEWLTRNLDTPAARATFKVGRRHRGHLEASTLVWLETALAEVAPDALEAFTCLVQDARWSRGRGGRHREANKETLAGLIETAKRL